MQYASKPNSHNEKSKKILNYIQKERFDLSKNSATTRRLFHRFKSRNNLHNMKIVGEAASNSSCKILNYIEVIIKQDNYPPDLVFNVDETDLFLKKNA